MGLLDYFSNSFWVTTFHNSLKLSIHLLRGIPLDLHLAEFEVIISFFVFSFQLGFSAVCYYSIPTFMFLYSTLDYVFIASIHNIPLKSSKFLFVTFSFIPRSICMNQYWSYVNIKYFLVIFLKFFLIERSSLLSNEID